MYQTDRNALDYESCRRVWRRVSPELDPYPEEKEATDCPAAETAPAASASRNSSLRALLPERTAPVRSSRLIHI